ncbi:MAG: class I SAM-dependent methyltransferase, partial [Candidatus Moraniibacteriota bacterium]
MKKELADKILNETEVGYDLISQKFSQTRKHFWRRLEFLADYVKTGNKVLDWGCGNGRLLELLAGKDFEYRGVDVSQKLIEFAKQKYQGEKIIFAKINNFAKPELNSVPELSSEKKVTLFEADSFDNIFSIAVFHHFPSASYRQEIAEQFFRLTKKDGRVIITVWHLWPACNTLLSDMIKWIFSCRFNVKKVTCNTSRSNVGKQKKYFKNIVRNWVSKILGKSKLDW